jgi:hypothetical protein
VVTLGGFGLYTLAGDAVVQARDPLNPKDQHDTFQLVLASTTATDTVVVFQNTVTGDLIKAPTPELPKLGMKRRLGSRP